MANPQEIQKAREAFGEWFPRHGALQTKKNDLYVAMHNALQAGQVDRHNLVVLGEGLKTALAQRKQEEVKTVVETAEAIHNAHGFRPAMSYLTGELQLSAPARATAPAKPAGARRVLMQLFRIGWKTHRYDSNLKPSEMFAAVQQALGPLQRGRAGKMSEKHAHLLTDARSVASKFEEMVHLHSAISEKTGLTADKVEKTLFPVYDKAFEVDRWAPSNMQEVLKVMVKGALDNKSFEKAVALYSAAIDRVAKVHAEKKRKAEGTWQYVSDPNVFRDVSRELCRSYERNPAITVAILEQVLKKHVKAYAAEQT